MNKLGIGAIIVSVALIFLLTSSQLAYAPPGPPANRVTFSFNQASTTDGGPEISMQGGGMWIVGVASSVNAAGGFNDLTTAGNWKAANLINVNPDTTMTGEAGEICSSCDLISSSSSTAAVFKGVFIGAGDIGAGVPPIIRHVVVSTGDICSCAGTQTLWVEGFGFGTANARFH